MSPGDGVGGNGSYSPAARCKAYGINRADAGRGVAALDSGATLAKKRMFCSMSSYGRL